jgi:hypothetical protein
MVAVDELIHSGGGALARLIAVLSAEVVPIRERRISSRLAAVYRQLTLLPANPTTSAAPSTAASMPA